VDKEDVFDFFMEERGVEGWVCSVRVVTFRIPFFLCTVWGTFSSCI